MTPESFDTPASETLPAVPPTKQRRTRIKGTKVDAGKALQLKQRGFTYQEIGDRMGASDSAVCTAIQRLMTSLPDPESVKAYEEQRPTLLTAAEMLLVQDITDIDKRAKASLNNVGYALTQVSNLRRLEQGKATSHVAILQLAASQADKSDIGDD